MKQHPVLFKTILMSAMALSTIPSPAQQQNDNLPALPPFPEIPAKEPIGSVKMGDYRTFKEVQLDIPIAAGPFNPTWASIEKYYPGTPQWLRDAKFGIWVHFGPQASGESGDWYARRIYQEGTTAYKNHLRRFGHPSEVGYKEVLHAWNPKKLNPCLLYTTDASCE